MRLETTKSELEKSVKPEQNLQEILKIQALLKRTSQPSVVESNISQRETSVSRNEPEQQQKLEEFFPQRKGMPPPAFSPVFTVPLATKNKLLLAIPKLTHGQQQMVL